MRKYLQVFIRCSSQTDGYFLWTGRRPDLSRGSKHLSRWVVEYAHKKSQVWQAWPRLLSKVASFIHEMMKKKPSLTEYYEQPIPIQCILFPRVSPSLVKRRKTHFHQLPIGASIILGNNGLVWLHPSREEEGGGESCAFKYLLELNFLRWRRLGSRSWCGVSPGARSILNNLLK